MTVPMCASRCEGRTHDASAGSTHRQITSVYQTSYGTVSSSLAALSAVTLIMRGYTPVGVPFLTSHSSIADHAVWPVFSRNGFLALALDRPLATNGPAGTMNTSTLTAIL